MLAAAIEGWAARFPERPAAIANGGPVTYAQLAAAIRAAEAELAGAAPPPGGWAVVLVPGLLRCWVTMLALKARGVHTVAVGAAGKIDAVAPGPEAVLVMAEGAAATPAEIGGRRVIAAPRFDPRPGGAGAPAAKGPLGSHHLYSSGATGAEKLIEMAAAHEAEVADARAATYGFDTNTVFHISRFGLWTAAGYKFPLAVWRAGGCVVFDQSRALYQRIASFGVTQAFMLPDMVEALVAARGPDEPRLDHLRLIVAGGVLSASSAAAAAARVTRNILNIYTSTEVNRTILWSRGADDPRALQWMTAPEDVELELVAADGAVVSGPGAGELRIRRIPSDSEGYLNAPEATAAHFRGPWFHPGDWAERREDGRIRILGRTDDLIVFKGQKIAAPPIEERLRDAIGGRAVCLFSGVDPAGEERVALAVEGEARPDEAILRKALAEGPISGPVAVSLVAEFPRTDNGMGKIRRAALRAAVFARLGLVSGD